MENLEEYIKNQYLAAGKRPIPSAVMAQIITEMFVAAKEQLGFNEKTTLYWFFRVGFLLFSKYYDQQEVSWSGGKLWMKK